MVNERKAAEEMAMLKRSHFSPENQAQLEKVLCNQRESGRDANDGGDDWKRSVAGPSQTEIEALQKTGQGAAANQIAQATNEGLRFLIGLEMTSLPWLCHERFESRFKQIPPSR